MQQDAQLVSTEQQAAQHCCSADCPAEEVQEDEEAVAHKVAATAAVHDHNVNCMPSLCIYGVLPARVVLVVSSQLHQKAKALGETHSTHEVFISLEEYLNSRAS